MYASIVIAIVITVKVMGLNTNLQEWVQMRFGTRILTMNRHHCGIAGGVEKGTKARQALSDHPGGSTQHAGTPHSTLGSIFSAKGVIFVYDSVLSA